MNKLDDIYSLTEFQRDAKTHIKHLKKSGRPAVLTINGKAALVVQDVRLSVDTRRDRPGRGD